MIRTRLGRARIRWSGRLLVAVAFMSLLAVPSGAVGRERVVSPSFHSLPSRSTGFVAIGERYAVYGNAYREAAAWIVDTKTLRTRKVGLPAGCTLGQSLASQHDRFMVDCEGGSVIIDSASGKSVWGPTSPLEASWAGEQWTWVGDQWVRELASGALMNWHTGERRQIDFKNWDPTTSLDDPDLGRRAFCAPFADAARYTSASQDRGYAYVVRGKKAQLARYVGRCGSGKLVKVHAVGSSAKPAGDSGSVLGGWAAWTSSQRCGGTISSYDIEKRRWYRWTTSGTPKKHCFVMYKTRYGVLTHYQVASGFDGSEEYPIFRAAVAKRPT